MAGDSSRKTNALLTAIKMAGAPGDEHERLKMELEEWARGLGYTSPAEFTDGSKPDILLVKPSNNFLFLGDAKDSAHERATRSSTAQRIFKYLKSYARVLVDRTPGEEPTNGGYIAIATNSSEAAEEWQLMLYYMTILAGISSENGEKPQYEIYQQNERTWIIYW